MTDWARRLALGGAGGLLLGMPALAQQTATSEASNLSIVDTPSVANAASHYNINGTFETAYDTNVTGSGAAVAGLRGLKQDDFIFTPTVLVDVFKNFGRESLFLTGSAGYSAYANNSILNRENLDLAGGGNAQLGLCRATVTGVYDRRQQQLEDITRLSVQDVFSDTSLGVEGACGRSIGFQPTFSFNQTWTNNSQAQLQSSNYTSTGGSGGIAYVTPTFGNLTVFGDYTSTTFGNRSIALGPLQLQDGFDQYGGGVRYSRLLGARIQGVVSLSYMAVRPFVGSAGFDGPTYSADITYRAGSRLSLHGNVTHDIQPSNVLDSDFYIETKGLVEANYQFSSRLSALLGVSDNDRTFKGPALMPGIDLTHDTLKSVYTTITYSVRKLFVALDVRYQNRDANLSGFSFPDTRVGLTVGTRF
ncbi:MAG TPA: outer membrane beta-barrel protein [Caulobacteraceae bacterium]|nr:outer membrane beta-barrel protein [Caulobacteraceae bacterium]